jgi:hypothetical protein
MHQFQEFVLLSHAMRNDLVDDEEDSIPQDLNELQSDDSAGIFIAADNPDLAEAFQQQLWAPEPCEFFHISGDISGLEEILESSKCYIGVLVLKINEEDIRTFKKQTQDAKEPTEEKTAHVVHLERLVKCWELIETKFGKTFDF